MRPDKTYAGKRVSYAWTVILPVVAERVTFRLNSGRRIRAEQERLIREKGLWSSSNPTGAAPYSPRAPHIRAGREDHALDIDQFVGDGEAGVQAELARLGLETRNPISAEPWHLEPESEGALLLVAARLSKRAIDVLGPRARRWAAEYLSLKAAGKDLGRRRVLRRVLTARRKAEWVAAHRGLRAGRAAAQRRYDVLRQVTS